MVFALDVPASLSVLHSLNTLTSRVMLILLEEVAVAAAPPAAAAINKIFLGKLGRNLMYSS